MEIIYLDNAATTPVRREVLEAMFPYFQQTFGNPSSVHTAGATAMAALEEARADIADVLSASPSEIFFTSGGTESDNLAILGAARAGRHKGRHVLVSSIEHEAVLQCVQVLEPEGFDVERLPVSGDGMIDPSVVTQKTRDDTILISCMYANNEVGTIQDVRAIAVAARSRNPSTVVHSDAVQAAGTLPLSVNELGVDLLTLSGHKLGGPRGVGVLYVKAGTAIEPISRGGGQERGLRSGTQDVASIVGIAKAITLAKAERLDTVARLLPLRDRLITAVLDAMPNAMLTGHPTGRLAGHASFCLSDRSSESVLVDLDVRGIMCSSGSACHAGMTDPSYVLLALGFSKQQAHNGLRMTLGRDATEANIDYIIAAIQDIAGETVARKRVGV